VIKGPLFREIVVQIILKAIQRHCSMKMKLGMHVNYNLISIKFVIIHAWSLLVEGFFKGVHLEFEKKTYSYILSVLDNSFYRLCFSKIATPHFFQLIPSHIKLNACSFMYSDFSEITQIKMCLCIARVFDDHRSCQKLKHNR
jgi:hypothetical protein